MSYSNIKDWVICYGKRLLSPRGFKINPSEIPLFVFPSSEVIINLNTTTNTIKTPLGFFRICLEHLSYDKYMENLASLYQSVPDNQKPARGYDFFIKKGVRDWRINNSKYKYQTYNACSSMAEEQMAELLGLERLLTRSYFCRIQIDEGKELVGTMSSFAEGVDVRELKDNFQDVFTPELAKDLTNLNIIDAICYEKDHRPGNYHIVMNKYGQAVSICSFDNDSPWSFSSFGRVSFETYAGASKLIKNGMINRPLLDDKVITRLLSLSKTDVIKSLSFYLRKNQIDACWKRISDLQYAIRRTKFKYEQWSDQVMKVELSGEYGKTYYSVLWELCTAIKKGII